MTGRGSGTATITAESVANPSVRASISITVKQPYTISFNVNAGDDSTAQCNKTTMTAYSGYAIGELPTATRDYYDFVGWYTAASGGTQVTSSSTPTCSTTMVLYAHWTWHDEFGWVLPSQVPSNGTITQYSYSYYEYTESTSSTLSGWTANGNYWKQTGTGSRDYATFPSTYKKGTTLYNAMNNAAYTASENETTKRTVSNSGRTGWIYWHWMYNVTYAAGTTRTISDRTGSWNADGSSGGNWYGYFYEIKSTVNCPYLDKYYCCSRSQAGYNCHSIIPSNADKSNTSGLGTDRFFRFEYYTSTYTDYQKMYKYYRYLQYQPSPVGSDYTTYVKYRLK